MRRWSATGGCNLSLRRDKLQPPVPRRLRQERPSTVAKEASACPPPPLPNIRYVGLRCVCRDGALPARVQRGWEGGHGRARARVGGRGVEEAEEEEGNRGEGF